MKLCMFLHEFYLSGCMAATKPEVGITMRRYAIEMQFWRLDIGFRGRQSQWNSWSLFHAISIAVSAVLEDIKIVVILMIVGDLQTRIVKNQTPYVSRKKNPPSPLSFPVTSRGIRLDVFDPVTTLGCRTGHPRNRPKPHKKVPTGCRDICKKPATPALRGLIAVSVWCIAILFRVSVSVSRYFWGWVSVSIIGHTFTKYR